MVRVSKEMATREEREEKRRERERERRIGRIARFEYIGTEDESLGLSESARK
jgi:hypothetical protein